MDRDAGGRGFYRGCRGSPLKNIYVGNLSYDTSEQQLESLFGSYGSVAKVSILRDQVTGKSRGFGFVEMNDDGEATAAIEALNGTDCSGRNLKVRPRKDSGGGDDGGRRW